MKPTYTTRRQFVKAAAASSVFSLIPGSVLGANEKVNVAYIGCGGQGASDANNVHRGGLVNAVALCDVALGTKHTAGLEGKFKDADTWNKTRQQIYDELIDLLPKQVDRGEVSNLLMLVDGDTPMTQEVKWACKYHRVRSVRSLFLIKFQAIFINCGDLFFKFVFFVLK